MSDDERSMTTVFTKLQQVCRIGTEKKGKEEGIDGFEFSAKYISADAAGGQRRAIDFSFQKQQREGSAYSGSVNFTFYRARTRYVREHC